MPGLLSHVFDTYGAGEEAADSHAGSDDLGGHADLNPSVSLHTESGGSVETPDGTTHSWSDTQDVSATADVGAAFTATNDYAADSLEG